METTVPMTRSTRTAIGQARALSSAACSDWA